MKVFKPLVELPEPTQLRSQKALERFLAAGEAMLASNSFEAAGVAEIAREAQSSVGTFYRLLEDKETLSLLLLQRFFINIETVVEETFDPVRWKDSNIRDIAGGFVDVFVQLYKGRRGVLRALILRASRDATFRDRVHIMNEHIAARVAAVMVLHRNAINHPQPKKAANTVVHIVLGALNQHTVTGSLGGLSQKDLKEELTRLVTGYLGVN